MPHQKHPKLPRPQLGRFARHEYAFVGTTCARIDGLLAWLREELTPTHYVLTVTGNHQRDISGEHRQIGNKEYHFSRGTANDYDDRLLGNRADLALVNGNHYPAARQIVFVDPKKAGTLKRRRDQLTDVRLVVLCPGAKEMPDWLAEYLTTAPPPATIQLTDENAFKQDTETARSKSPIKYQEPRIANLYSWLLQHLPPPPPPLKALLLAGGQSSRMGQDKADLVYHDGQTELDRMTEMCQNLGLDTYLSVARPEDRADHHLPKIADRFPGLGPFGAILTALQEDPDAAWLVLACDLPLLGPATLAHLIQARHPRSVATSLRDARKPFPEPLVAIYEPRAYPRLLQFLALGYACPRKTLINSNVHVVDLEDARPLTNANDPSARAEILGNV